jgi:hypothetical protein
MKIFKIIFLFVFCILYFGLNAKEFYVSPNGNDHNSGIKSAPFKTIIGARNAIRNLPEKERKQNIEVILGEGDYFIDETIVFGLEDSAPEGYKYTYRSAKNEKVLLSAGKKVKNWSLLKDYPSSLPNQAKGKVWVADIPKSKYYPYVLFNGLKRLNRARSDGFQSTQLKFQRFPSRNVANPEDRKLLKRMPFPEGEIRNWSNLEDAEVFFCPVPWCINFSPIEKVDWDEKIAWLKYEGNSPPFTTPKDYNPAFVENIIDYLDEPGEWVYNSQESKIYYWPQNGIPGENIILPTLLEYIKVEGEINYEGATDIPAKNIVFKGITFAHGNRYSWWDEHKGWGIQHDWDKFDNPNAMLRFRGAENCSVEECRFTASGNSAIRLDLHCQNISIENNLIDYVGHMGILLSGYGPGTKDVNKNNRIVNNIIDHCGEVVWHGHAIFIWQSGSNYVANNLIQNCPRKAVGICGVRAPIFIEGKKVDWDEASKTMRWQEIDPILNDPKNITQETILPYLHAKDNLVENNEIFRCRTKIGDGSSLNVSGAGQGNIVRNNLLLEVVGNGLRTDDWQRGTLFSNNLICSGGIVHKGKNDILNNIFVDTNIRFTTYPGQKYFPGSEVKNNIMYFTRAGIIPYKERKIPEIYTPDDCVLENNIYFAESRIEEIEDFIHENQTEKGWDKGSIVVDPLFANPIPKNRRLRKVDLVLSENSPAYKMGFKKINVESIGITNDFPSKLKVHIFPEFERNWISESAGLRFSSIADSINNYEKIILQSKSEPEISFSIKTKTEQNPYAVIDLKTKKEIESFSIIGNSKNADKSYNSLVVYVSNDNVNWELVWKNDPYHAQTGRMWEVVLQNKIEARFVKIQLEGEHVLTLKTVNIYGS